MTARLPFDPLFQSAHQALMFALTYSDSQQGDAAAAERRIATFARERYPNPPPSGRGLSGLDGAAQAGMIQRRLSTLQPLHQAALVARFAVTRVADRQAACAMLALKARHELPHTLSREQAIHVATLLMRRLHGLRVDLGRLADECDVTERTMTNWRVRVHKWLRPVQQRAMDAAEGVLVEAGIVGAAV